MSLAAIVPEDPTVASPSRLSTRKQPVKFNVLAAYVIGSSKEPG